MAELYVAMMRGINVGGKNRVTMRDLVSIFEKAGCKDVCTYIQSGNVIFSGSRRIVEALPEKVSAEMHRRLGFDALTIVRSATELRGIIARNPFAKRHGDVHVMFLSSLPKPADVDELDSLRSPGDTFVVLGGEIFLLVTNGMGKTKLTNAYFDRALNTTSTARNWRTVLALEELARTEPA